MSLLKARLWGADNPGEVSAEVLTGSPQFDSSRRYHAGLIGRCANPNCSSGWLHLFRQRITPVFEDGWTCSPECTERRIFLALQRELYDAAICGHHRHRVPIGLLMLAHGWITRAQLRKALQSQKKSGVGRLGDLLVDQCATDEATVTRALALQWSCPVLTPERHSAGLAYLLPRLLIEQTGGLPVRLGTPDLIYVGFEEHLDPVVTLAVQRMNQCRAEAGIVPCSLYRPALARTLQGTFPSVQLAEAFDIPAAAHLLARAIERARPIASRLVRVHGYLWLRMWLASDSGAPPSSRALSDVVCTIGAFR